VGFLLHNELDADRLGRPRHRSGMKTVLPLVLAVLVSSSAFAWGPVVEGGVVITPVQTSGAVTFTNLVGPRLLAGLEVGDRFNHELGFEFSRVTGSGVSAGVSVPGVVVQSLAGRYTFSVDFLGKKGFTPLVGVGLAVGQADLRVDTVSTQKLWLAFHAVAGARYTFENGLGLKLQFTVSTHGGFVGLEPSLVAAWRF
jgi:hypothetical protein